MDEIYNNKVYLSNNPDWHAEDAPQKAANVYSLLKQNNIPFKSVCEVGCGVGEILVQLDKLVNDKNINYFGFDISQDAIGIASKKQSNNIQFELKDISKSNNTDQYDVLLVIDILEHLKDYFSFLQGLSKKAKYTVFHIPLDMFVWSLFKEKMLIESKSRVGHIHNFSEDFILSVLNDYGYTVINKKYTNPDYTSASFKQSVINSFKKFLAAISPRFCSKTLGGFSLMVLCKNPE